MTIERDLTPNDLKGDFPENLSAQDLKEWKYQRYMQDYLRCVAAVDDNVGRMLDRLDETGLTENTVVIYTSDQGFFLGDHGWFDKRFMYEESLRMPLLIRYPKWANPGSVQEGMVLNIDFAPTFLDLAGASIPDDMQGESFLQILKGKSPRGWRRSMYYHYYEYPAVHSVKKHYGIRTERHKLIHFYDDIDAWELYDLAQDPDELHNLYGQPGTQEVTQELQTELRNLRERYKVQDA
jgi:arylsulfatase A-like enzyme